MSRRRSSNGHRLMNDQRGDTRRCPYCENGNLSRRSERPGRREHRLDNGTTEYCQR